MGATETSKEQVVAALRAVIDPQAQRDVATLGYVHQAAYCDGVARVVYQLPANLATAERQHALREQTLGVVGRLPGVREVHVDFSVVHIRSTNTLPGVKHVLAVGAGKGGVGKSTVAVLAAAGLTRRGLKVGLLDADVYGPSLPKLTGTEGLTPLHDESGRIYPPARDGIKVMSMGHIVPPDQAIVWRGPMAQKYIKEFLDRGAWEELDYLIVDLPPGTGDIPLTLAQSIPLTGAVIVCTPQDVALLDALKALRMYRKLGVEPLGFVENMSYYLCPHCGQRDEIFSHGGVERAAAEQEVPFLGAIPLNIAIRQYGDAGDMLASFTKTPDHVRAALDQLCDRLIAEVERRARQALPLPQLRVSG
jgi:ATP-binding protein involved in chromosome partitioning